MKKITSILLCLLASYNISQASIFKFGPKFAINSSNLRATLQAGKSIQFSAIAGFQAGILARLDLPIIYIQPELLFTHFGTNYTWKGQAVDLRYNKLELPVLVGVTVLGLVRLQAGPTFSALLSAKEYNKHIKLDSEIVHSGYQVGIGVDIWRLIIDLKYEGGLTKLSHKIVGGSIDSRPSIWLLSIGVNIL